MRWLVTGAGGMLGRDVVSRLGAEDAHVTALTRADLDITSASDVEQAVSGSDVVVNCAAWTAVDDAEGQESEAFAVNAVGAANLARAAAQHDARVVHISTDYVFAGTSTDPYLEDAPLDPRSAYGRTKSAGEWAVRAEAADHLIVRTAWLYGEHGGCFPRTIATAASQRDHLDVVDDQCGQPTWTVDVADLVVRLVQARVKAGTYHATAAGSTTWYGFAREVVTAAGMSADKVRPTTTEAFPRPAPRPAYSVLGHDALLRVGVAPIGDWKERWRVAAPRVLSLVQ